MIVEQVLWGIWVDIGVGVSCSHGGCDLSGPVVARYRHILHPNIIKYDKLKELGALTKIFKMRSL